MSEPYIINQSNISLAWSEAFHAILNGTISISTSLIITAGPFNGNQTTEILEIRRIVDEMLRTHSKLSCKVNADLIFPTTLWRQTQALGRLEFFRRYIEDYYPRLRARDKRRNGKGTYFLRMIGWGLPPRDSSPVDSVNQLEHVIELYKEGEARGQRPRHAALQIACFDPTRDHTKAVRSIFPCLQQIGLVYGPEKTLTLNAYYPSQYIFDRGYGNYLGLTNLGIFLANEMGLKFTRLTCFIGSPKLGDATKASLRSFSESLLSLTPMPDTERVN